MHEESIYFEDLVRSGVVKLAQIYEKAGDTFEVMSFFNTYLFKKFLQIRMSVIKNFRYFPSKSSSEEFVQVRIFSLNLRLVVCFQALVDLQIAEHANIQSNNFKTSKGLKLVSQSDNEDIRRMFKILKDLAAEKKVLFDPLHLNDDD